MPVSKLPQSPEAALCWALSCAAEDYAHCPPYSVAAAKAARKVALIATKLAEVNESRCVLYLAAD